MIAATGWDLIKEVHPSKGRWRCPRGSSRCLELSTLDGADHRHRVSFFVGTGIVEWFLHWVRKHGFTMFAIYRILLGGALLIWGARLIAR